MGQNSIRSDISTLLHLFFPSYIRFNRRKGLDLSQNFWIHCLSRTLRTLDISDDEFATQDLDSAQESSHLY